MNLFNPYFFKAVQRPTDFTPHPVALDIVHHHKVFISVSTALRLIALMTMQIVNCSRMCLLIQLQNLNVF